MIVPFGPFVPMKYIRLLILPLKNIQNKKSTKAFVF